jgi:hypothetical protein
MKRQAWLGVIAVLFALQAVLHHGFIFDRWRNNYSAGKGVLADSLNADQILLQLFGFREFLAGILWVRADSFFDSGNYDAVLPIIRLCTILDPKQLDIYATGMWHIAYNFTDEEHRSDRRYIPYALALGKEGSRQNPHTYEIFFETGWIWYHKIGDDFHQAVHWWEEAHKREDIQPARRHLLSNAYQRNGQVEDGLALYFRLLNDAEERLKKDGSFGNKQIRDTIENNIDTMIVRMVQRGWLANKGKQVTTGAYDTNPPFDVGFSGRVTVEEPRVIRVEGTWNVLPVGTRVRTILRDANYPNARPAALEWDAENEVRLDPPREWTFMQDELFVKNRQFGRRIDMSKDPTMYPFTSDRYYLEFYYNPRIAPPHIQDKFGFVGEGFTDSNFLNTEVREGQRVVFARLELTREQLLRRGEWDYASGKVPIVQTENFVKRTNRGSDDDVIHIPNLRAGS